MKKSIPLALCALAYAAPLAARENLGVFDEWGAFRDREVPRCYAISAAASKFTGSVPFASVGTWPERKVRNQVHLRVSRTMAKNSPAILTIGTRRFALKAEGRNAWAADRRMDAAIVAAMRSAAAMSLTGRDSAGKRFTDRYELAGFATAMDAAAIGCARMR